MRTLRLIIATLVLLAGFSTVVAGTVAAEEMHAAALLQPGIDEVADDPMRDTAVEADEDADAAAMGLRRLYQWHWYVSVKVPTGEELGVKAHQGDAFKELHRCFKCSFPVSGAPKKYPKAGQRIPLKACFVVFCKKAPVKFYQGSGFFYFVAQKGHFDGAGSKVYFHFWTDSHGYLRMTTTGYVAKPTIKDAVNKEGAYQAWHNFALRLGQNLFDRCSWVC